MSDDTSKSRKKKAGVAKQNLVSKVLVATAKPKQKVIESLDVNKDGSVDIEDIIILSLRIPGVRINRSTFLQKEFQRGIPQSRIDRAILTTPMQAGIAKSYIDQIADEVIQYERNCVSGIAAALGAPGGFAVVATIPADIVQYYGYMLRAAQKLMYLYGFPDLGISDNSNSLDSETLNILIVSLGVMYGVAGANNALKKIASMLATGVEKKLMNKALTKTTIFPVVRSIASWFNVKMTKTMYAGLFKKSLPVIGGVIGGGMTYLSFKPCCNKLKKSLENSPLFNPQLVEDPEEFVVLNEEG